MNYNIPTNFTLNQGSNLLSTFMIPNDSLQASQINSDYKAKHHLLSEDLAVDSPSSTQDGEECSQSSEAFVNLRATRRRSSPVEGTNSSPKLARKSSLCSVARKESDLESILDFGESEVDQDEVQSQGLSGSEGWNEKQDKVLKSLATKCKYDWKKIAKKFNARQNTDFAPIFLQQKYKQITKPTIPLRIKFTKQEDLMIAKNFEMYGCDWVKIAGFFTDRTAIMLKNRYYSHIRKRDLLNVLLDEVNDDKAEGEVVDVVVKLEEKESDSYLSHNTNVSLPRGSEGRLNYGNFEANVDVFQGEFDSEFKFLDFSMDYCFISQATFDMENELKTELNERVTIGSLEFF